MTAQNGLKKPRTLEDALKNLGHKVAANPNKKSQRLPRKVEAAEKRLALR